MLWCVQDGGDEAVIKLDAAAPVSAADGDLDHTATVAETVRELPAAGMIKFQPSSEYIQHAVT